MQKKLLALAVAGALAPAAAMAQSTVEIYGRANLGWDNYRATGSTIAGNSLNSRNRVFDQGSRVGFRVNEALGGGMRAFVVIESGVSLDTGNNLTQGGAANASTGFWASRSSYVGLGGGWGDVRFGRQDVFYGNGIIQQAAANYINTAVDAIWTQHGRVVAPGGRTSNVLSFNSATMGGFNASLTWAPLTSEGAAFTGTGQEKDARWSITARYTGGALRGQFDWAQDTNVGNLDGQKNKGWKVGLGWAYAPGSQISVVTGRLENQRVGADNDPRVNITTFNLEHMLGQVQLIGQYMMAGKVSGAGSSDNTRVRGITAGAKYFLSKRTGVYAAFSQYRNEEAAFADFGPGGGLSSAAGGALVAANAGADPRIVAVGIMHNF